ncbi:hypothetical protein Tcan_14942 [Toxocara canis]|uniref:Uncharacterized protein n=1 Tax=Toxocara canis TaxID=6265 RepID=A0A0B2V6P7_TOXCA|nr:hypothetical protein Tcan_14942 [Toxocara canis]
MNRISRHTAGKQLQNCLCGSNWRLCRQARPDPTTIRTDAIIEKLPKRFDGVTDVMKMSSLVQAYALKNQISYNHLETRRIQKYLVKALASANECLSARNVLHGADLRFTVLIKM